MLHDSSFERLSHHVKCRMNLKSNNVDYFHEKFITIPSTESLLG